MTPSTIHHASAGRHRAHGPALAAAMAAFTLLTALTACSTSTSSTPPPATAPGTAAVPSTTITGTSPVTSPTNGASSSPAPWETRRYDMRPHPLFTPIDKMKQGVTVMFGVVKVNTPEERAVAEAYAKYSDVTARLYNQHVLDQAAIDSVAVGPGKELVVTDVTARADKHLSTVGNYVVNVLSVHVTGTSAELTSCDWDGTEEVNLQGQPVTDAPGESSGTIPYTLQNGTWKLAGPMKDLPACDAKQYFGKKS